MFSLIQSKTGTLLSVVFVLPLLVAVACRDFDDRTGSSGLTPPPIILAEGIWEGDWTTLVGTGDAGLVTFVIDQDPDGILSGCSCWTGSACWDDGQFSGTVSGGEFRAAVVMEVLKDPNTIFPAANRRDGIVVAGRLNIIGDLLTGSFSVNRDDERYCSDSISRDGDEGTLRLTRTLVDVDGAAVCLGLRDDGLLQCSDFVLPTE